MYICAAAHLAGRRLLVNQPKLFCAFDGMGMGRCLLQVRICLIRSFAGRVNIDRTPEVFAGDIG